jgi:hypothetical protein
MHKQTKLLVTDVEINVAISMHPKTLSLQPSAYLPELER